MEITSIEYKCTSCGKLFSLPLKQAPAAFNLNDCICNTCVMKYYFDITFDEYPNPDNITYTYINGTETKTLNGFIRSVCPSKSAILNNI